MIKKGIQNMNMNELSRYYWLKKEVKDLEQRLEEFGTGVSAVALDKEIKGTGQNISIQEKRTILVEKLINARLTALEEYLKIESYIENVDDPEIRQIMRYRFLDLNKWETIDRLMLCGKDYARKKYYNYYKK